MQTDDHFLIVARYVQRNALRACLVQRAESWKWCSLWQTEQKRSDVLLSPWPVPAGSQWLDYVNQPQSELELGTLRHACNSGRPFGGNDWINETAKKLGLESTLRSRRRR